MSEKRRAWYIHRGDDPRDTRHRQHCWDAAWAAAIEAAANLMDEWIEENDKWCGGGHGSRELRERLAGKKPTRPNGAEEKKP